MFIKQTRIHLLMVFLFIKLVLCFHIMGVSQELICAKSYIFCSEEEKVIQLPIDIQLQMFDTIMILWFYPFYYNVAGVTCVENHNMLESLCLEFYKIILNVKINTPNLIMYA